MTRFIKPFSIAAALVTLSSGPAVSQTGPPIGAAVPSVVPGRVNSNRIGVSGPAVSGPLTLAGETQQALQVNPAIVQASQRLRASEARLREQIGLRYPQYGLNATLSENKATGYSPFSTASTVLSVPLNIGGRNGQLIRQAQADLNAARWTFRRAQADLVLQVATAYYGALRTDQETRIALDAFRQAWAQQDAAQKRFAVGDVPRTDVLKAEVQVARARADFFIAQNASHRAQATLNSLVGRALTRPVTLLAAETIAQPPRQYNQLAVQLERFSPEVVAAREQVVSAEAALAIARLEGQPQFGLQGTYTHTGDPTTYPNAVGVGVSVSVPLPDGGVRRSHVEQAQAALEQARAGLQIARQQGSLNLENAVSSLQDARQRVDITLQGVTLALESLRASTIGYAEGVATARDVIDAQVALRQARIQRAESLYDYNLAVSQIYSVLGASPPEITLPHA